MEQSVEDTNVHHRFDLERHVERFRNNPKFKTHTLAEIHKILTSSEYSEFINEVYMFLNGNSPTTQGRLKICQYNTAPEIIDDFWNNLLGINLIKQLCCKP